MERFDVAIIGGGLLGCFMAREMCRGKLSIVLLEAREDVCTGISRANTAIIYPGYDHQPGTRKAEMCVRANASFDRLCRELDVPFSRCGSLMLSYGPRADTVLRKKFRQGQENGVPDLRLLVPEEAYTMEPMLASGLSSALFSPTAGTVNPWQLGIAACENAVQNGTELRLNTRVVGMRAREDGYILMTDRGTMITRSVINCAGLDADRVQKMLFPSPIRIVRSAGDYLVLNRHITKKPGHILELEPENKEKGLTVVPTVEGSLLLGPTEREVGRDKATAEDGLARIRTLMKQILPELDEEEIVRAFAAMRPKPQRPDGKSIRDFCIEHPAERFWSLIGVKTPGLTCARELGAYVAERLTGELGAESNPDFDRVRCGIRRVRALSFEQRRDLVEEDPSCGEIICFCEDVTKAEVLEAIRRGAVTLDGIKRRVGTGMGCCQGARCEQKIAALLSEVLGIPESTIRKDGPGSEIVRGRE